MPFLDDSGIKPEAQRGPLVAAFATLLDQIERLIVVNIMWAVQVLPGLIALGVPELPMAIRWLLLFYTGFALAPATGTLFGVALSVCQGQHLSPALAYEHLRSLLMPSLRALAPIYGLFGLLGWAIMGVDMFHLLALAVLFRLTLLLLLLCSMYWGPLFAADPAQSAGRILRRSIQLGWREPYLTLLTFGVVVVALLIGTISIGGLFLVVPVLVALLQTRLYQATTLEGDA
jgi:hypothetical protein